MTEDSALMVSRTTGLSSGGFTNLSSAGENFTGKPSVAQSNLPAGTSVTVLKIGRSAIILGPGGYASANPGE